MVLGADLFVLVLSPLSYRAASRANLMHHTYLATAPSLMWFTVLTATFSLVLIRIDSLCQPCVLIRLVVAAVVLQTGKASPGLVAQAVEAASAQGWRRPLLAWLKVQLKLAEQGRATSEVDRIRRRIELVQGKP